MQTQGLHLLDWLLIATYGIAVVAIGWYYSRKQQDSSDFFTGGGNMKSGFIGISLFVTLFSTISYLAHPGEIIKHGPIILCGLLSAPVTFLIVGYVLIPKFMKFRVTSAYELLEARLGLPIRLLGASMFIVLRLVWMGLMLYLTSSVLLLVLGLERDALPWVATGCGIIAVVYTSIGGIRTVVVTDFIQFILLLGGALLTLIIITVKMKGLGWFPTEWVSTWDHQPLYSFDPHVRVTVVGAILAQFIWQMSTAGGDQTAIQRYMATPSAAIARRSYLITVCAQIFVTLILTLVGFALLGLYTHSPNFPAEGMTLANDADMFFPLFIASYLPIGVAGLVVVALFAAAMSSIDSGINSITAVVQTDFIDRVGQRKLTLRNHLWVSRGLSFFIGAIVVSASTLMDRVPGNFLEVTQKTTNLLVTPMFMLFFLALFVPFATRIGAIAGCVCGIATAVTIGYWDVITGLRPLSFQWISISALSVNMVVSCTVSWFTFSKAKGVDSDQSEKR